MQWPCLPPMPSPGLCPQPQPELSLLSSFAFSSLLELFSAHLSLLCVLMDLIIVAVRLSSSCFFSNLPQIHFKRLRGRECKRSMNDTGRL